MIIKPGQTGADSSTSELGLTTSSSAHVGQMPMMVPATSGVMMAPAHGAGPVMVSHMVGGPMQVPLAPGVLPAGNFAQPGLLTNAGQPQLVYQHVPPQQQQQQQQMNRSGSMSNLSTPNLSLTNGATYMAVPAGNFSGSGSTGLAPMMVPAGTVIGPGVVPSIQPQQQVMHPGGGGGTPHGGALSDPNDSGPKQLIVNYIPTQVTEFELRSLFDQHGAVECARVIYDKTTGVSKGYGFVYYFNSAHAAIALKEMQGFELYGKPMRVGYAMPQRPLAALSPYGSQQQQQQQQVGSPLPLSSNSNPSPTIRSQSGSP